MRSSLGNSIQPFSDDAVGTEAGFVSLKSAIDSSNLSRVRELMKLEPQLPEAPLGYGKNGPLTWVAECRIPWEPPSPARLAIAQWMIDNGSDVHQGGDGPLMRAALMDYRIPMMELLLANGADVNARATGGQTPIFHAVTQLNDFGLAAARVLIERGADLTLRANLPGHYERPDEMVECTPLEYALLFPAGETERETVALLR